MSDKVNYRDVLVFVSTKMVIFVAIIFDYPSMDKDITRMKAVLEKKNHKWVELIIYEKQIGV